MTLVDQDQLEKHLQITFGTQPNDPVVDQLLAESQSAAEGYCRQSLEYDAAIAETFEVDQPESWHVLDRFPISGVTSVEENGNVLTDQTDYRWYTHGTLRRVSGTEDASWSTNVDAVDVV